VERCGPDDRPDTIDVGPVVGIPIIDDDDPRFENERRARSAATAKAQAMHTTDALLDGLRDDDWMVRYEVVDRLTAHGKNDPRTLPALLEAASDVEPAVRDAVVMRLCEFSDPEAFAGIKHARNDPDEDVRSSAEHAIGQWAGKTAGT
jgi:HEAT repeat protein